MHLCLSLATNWLTPFAYIRLTETVGPDASNASLPQMLSSSSPQYILNGMYTILSSDGYLSVTDLMFRRFADRIAPWVHYVPIQVDNSDLHDALMFFRGDANGDGAHEDLARKIAVEGRKWSKEYWRREDLVAYFFRFVSLSSLILVTGADLLMEQSYAGILASDAFGSGGYVVPWRWR